MIRVVTLPVGLFILGTILCSVGEGQAQMRRAKRLEQLDRNKDGKLSANELSPVLWKRLKSYDIDGDDALSKKELAASGFGPKGKQRQPGGANAAFEVKTFRGTNGESLAYSLFVPEQAKKTKNLFPLVVCLHGRGGNTAAANIAASKRIQSKNPCYVMAPGIDSGKERWARDMFRSKPSHRSVLPELIEAIDDLVKKHSIDRNRIYLTGQSMGGVGTWGVLANYPDKFAAAAPVCGIWSVEDAVKMKNVPLWAFHGAKDSTVPVRGSRDMIAAIKKAGGQPKYTEFPDVGHGSWQPAYAKEEFWTWLFEQSLEKRK